MSLIGEEQATQALENKQQKETSRRLITPRVVVIGIVALTCSILAAIFVPGILEQISTRISPSNFIKYTTYLFMYPAMGLLGLIIGAGFATFVVNTFGRMGKRWDKMEIGDKVDLFLGIFAGIIASLPFYNMFQNINSVVSPAITFFLMIGFSAVSVYALRSVSEVMPWHKQGGVKRHTGTKVLDTNVLIDGRLYDIVKTGFIEGEFYVPQFVLLELQHIADSADSLRRQRGRRGLEILRHLQSEFNVRVGEYDKYAKDEKEEVDSRLVRVAKAVGGDLVSNDYNLNRVARIQDVRVLNINDLALSLRPTVLPGETMEIALIREGSQFGQAVGYLDDGTMIVVEQGRPHIGETVTVLVTQVIQTERGKMIFASMDDDLDAGNQRRGKNGR